ncbi:hypothetical protein H7F51_17330, partial [Novosphingobium flavum]
MAIVARISGKSGKLLRTVALHHGANAFRADPDAVVVIIDEATGKVVDQADLARTGGQVVVNLPEGLGAATGAAAEAAGLAPDGAGGGASGSAPAGGASGDAAA